VTFAGSPDRVEAQLVPDAGYEFDPFRVSGFPREASVALLRSLVVAGKAPLECREILARRRPDVVLGGGGYVAGPMVLAAWTRKLPAALTEADAHLVLGGGGYVAGPMVLAAWLKRIPAALTEADAHLGLANRLAAPFAQRVFLSFPIPGREPPKFVVTGRPVPARSRLLSREEGRRLFELPAEGPVLLVFGGSQGARSLNELVVEHLGPEGPAVLHLAGERDYEELRGRVSRRDYRLVPFTHEFGAALGAADLVLCRAGGSVYELAAAAKPAVLVPYPHATADHQAKNARYFEQAGAAVVVQDTEIARVPALVRELLAEPARLATMSERMRAVARPDAADRIAEELIALAGR
jgi:UDP-N-acetylglucosamine--N-acetylmuramyl-(pentapeptide) pyrophosphoryl-undecaprenol N-acetylglucosamine transferase